MVHTGPGTFDSASTIASTTVAWWNCFAGIAGNMAFGALVDAGADLGEVKRVLQGLPLRGWVIQAREVLRAGVACTHLEVLVDDDPAERTYAKIVSILTEATLPPRVQKRSLAAFERLGRVEGRLHGVALEEVHFHEVGSLDAIIDIVGTCVALEVLGVDEVCAGPVAQGSGMVSSSHGLLPVPAPAVVELFADAGAPMYGTAVQMELTTPTGAALLTSLCRRWGPMPQMSVSSTGFGAGSKDIDGLPNAAQVIVGKMAVGGGSGLQGSQPLIVLEATVDDVTGEVLAATTTALLDQGALDAWTTSVVGKKGRPAHVVTALCDPSKVDALREALVRETGTLGVRASTWHRWPSARTFVTVDVRGFAVRVKVGPHRMKAEYEDTAIVAGKLGLPVREVARMAESEAHGAEPHRVGGHAGQAYSTEGVLGAGSS